MTRTVSGVGVVLEGKKVVNLGYQNVQPNLHCDVESLEQCVCMFMRICVCLCERVGMGDVWFLHHIDDSCGRFEFLFVHFSFVFETFRGKRRSNGINKREKARWTSRAGRMERNK